ncbi:50S ribosomal protein L29 [Solidesulfovibrio magneticus]|uniref:Large ribosomal subunit protein uL29 n=1 Tax=Solidesulfovibrio magneticus (strain ATCC 700980 / DSM 13731 / RS-1) TaxID=573370 RepID=RL29_SOLM1|nr:50S ribosomal protein L29 [Solidesulfovibrio magneticus]C4XLY1.1 RecName: Full=Large ribosomal subunit protein uL29; AltName: Full=50S ribosomal protein L29 [Solidesulfovibrio magneticus RS-1]BAH74719.1 50S ribosomal protein L29 [Solidesulfovibrio magneticus RS-1]
MKTAELRDLDIEALGKKLGESREELFKLRFQHATAQLEKTHRLREVRKDIARIMTVQTEKKRQG